MFCEERWIGGGAVQSRAEEGLGIYRGTESAVFTILYLVYRWDRCIGHPLFNRT